MQQTDVPHWLKYVRWEVISRWRSRALAGAGTRRYPYAFASGDRAFPRINGGVLWLISSPRYGAYRLPPSIIARLRITDVVPANHPKAQHVDPEVRKFGPWVAIAAADPGAYLPLNNVSRTLEKLRFQGRVDRLPAAPPMPDGTPVERPYSHLPRHFQRHRVLAPGSVMDLERYADAVRTGRRVFVSYRWSDFDRDQAWVEELSAVLTKHTVSCWLDRWNMPQASKAPIKNELLSHILNDAVRQSAWFVALMRPNYVRAGADPQIPTWVRHEWDQAGGANTTSRRDQMSRVAVLFGELPGIHDWIDSEHDHVITVAPDESARRVAQRLLALLAGAPPPDAAPPQ